MKRAITLWVLIIFAGTFTYGQKTSHLDHYRSLKNRSEKQASVQLQKHNSIFPGLFLKQNNSFNFQQKSSLAYTHKLDSITSVVYSMSYESKSKHVFIYDTKGKNTESVVYSVNTLTNQYEPVSKNEYTYNAAGYLSQDISSYWESSMQQWIYASKTEESYDANGNLKQEVYSNYDQTSAKWITDTKYEYTYNNQNLILEDIGYYWDIVSGKWIPQFKYAYTYDVNGNELTYISYNWDITQSKWVNGLKEENTYNSSGYLIQSIAYNWDQNTWEKDWKDEYTYDAAGYISSDIYSNWDIVLNDWHFESKDEYVFDTDDNLTQWIYYQWDDSDQLWEKNMKGEYTYDMAFKASEILFPATEQDIDFLSGNMLTEMKTYNWQESEDKWEMTMHQIYYYSKQAKLSTDRFDIPGLKIYPNPVPLGDELKIDSEIPIEKVTIFSLLGQQLKEVNDPSGNIDLADLSRGIYIIRIFSDKGSTARKLIKE